MGRGKGTPNSVVERLHAHENQQFQDIGKLTPQDGFRNHKANIRTTQLQRVVELMDREFPAAHKDLLFGVIKVVVTKPVRSKNTYNQESIPKRKVRIKRPVS